MTATLFSRAAAAAAPLLEGRLSALILERGALEMR